MGGPGNRSADELTGIWAFNRNDIWVAGEQSVLRWNGSNWSRTEVPQYGGGWKDLWGSSPNDVWLVGDPNVLLRWNGGAWQAVEAPSGFHDGIWGSGRKDVSVMGWHDLLHWDGLNLTSVDVVFPKGAGDVWGFGPDDVWMVRGDSNLAHFDGTRLNVHFNEFSAGLRTLWGASSSDIWGAGDLALAHWDGRVWSQSREKPRESTAFARHWSELTAARHAMSGWWARCSPPGWGA